MTRRRHRLAVLGLALACIAAGCESAPDDPYQVSIDVEPWIAALGSEDLFESDEATQALVALGDAAVPALVAALEREKAAIRVGVVDALHGIGGRRVLTPLLRAAGDDDLDVRESAIAALADFDDVRAISLIEATLADPAPAIRRVAAAACGSLCRSEAAFRQLVELALDPETLTLSQTARAALQRAVMKRPTARAAMEHTVPSALAAATTPMARLRAALLLADMRDPRAVAPLMDTIESAVGTPIERLHVVLALGMIEDPSAVSALARVAAGTSRVQTDAACGALRTLAERRTAGAAEALTSCPGRLRNVR